MSIKGIITRRVMSVEEAAKVWAVSNWVAIATHLLACALGVMVGARYF